MRLLYLANARIPSRAAHSVHVMKMCQAFARLGHDVTLVTPDYPDVEAGVADPFAFYGVEDCFAIDRLAVPSGRLQRRSLWKYETLVRRFVRNHRPELVYARCHGLGIFDPGHLEFPLILEAHLLHPHSKQFEAVLANRQLRHVVVISQQLRVDYQSAYAIRDEQIRVAYDAADEPVPDVSCPLRKRDRVNVGYVGQLYKGKGVELILQIAAMARWADFHVVGGTEEDIRSVQSTIDQMPLDNVVLYGFRPPHETDAFRAGCDILIAPYQRAAFAAGNSVDIARWMSPLKLAEYMAAGKPIVTSDLPVLREMVEHGTSGWLCQSDCAEEWVQTLRKISDDGVLRQRLAAGAYEAFQKRFTWSQRAQTVLA